MVGTSGKREEVGKVHGRVNTVQILCTHVCKVEKCYLLKIIQEWKKEYIKENCRRGEFKYLI
jgi:hypothetical protein